MRRLLTGLLATSLLVGACGDDDAGDDSAVTSIPDETTTSSSTTEPPVPPIDVIPSDPSLITEEYVEQVLDALYEVSLEAVELARAGGLVDSPSIERVESINSEATAVEAINSLLSLTSEGFPDFKEELSPVRANVIEVVERDEACVFAEVEFDTSGLTNTVTTNPPNARTFARLIPASAEQKGSGLNPTAWVLDVLPATEDGSLPDQTCSAL